MGGSACPIPGLVLGTDRVVEVARWRFVDRHAPEVLAVPPHGLLVPLPLGTPAHYHLAPVVGHGRALVVVHTGAYLDVLGRPRRPDLLHVRDHGRCRIGCDLPTEMDLLPEVLGRLALSLDYIQPAILVEVG